MDFISPAVGKPCCDDQLESVDEDLRLRLLLQSSTMLRFVVLTTSMSKWKGSDEGVGGSFDAVRDAGESYVKYGKRSSLVVWV